MEKAILFDLDGTLTDSGEGIINCAELALRHFGLPIPNREEMRTFVGPPLGDTFRRFGVPANRVEEAIAVYRSRYIPIGKFENIPYDGVKQLLDAVGGFQMTDDLVFLFQLLFAAHAERSWCDLFEVTTLRQKQEERLLTKQRLLIGKF